MRSRSYKQHIVLPESSLDYKSFPHLRTEHCALRTFRALHTSRTLRTFRALRTYFNSIKTCSILSRARVMVASSSA